MKRQVPLLGIVLAVVLLLTLAGGCGLFEKDEVPAPGDKGDDAGENSADENGEAAGGDEAATGRASSGGEEGAEEKKKEERKVKITLYFGDKKAIEKGKPGKTGYVRPVVREFSHTTAVLRLALQELIRGPLAGEGNLVRTLPATVKILKLDIEKGVALIDLSSELLTDSRGGTLEGSLLVQSLVFTATQFPTVKSTLVTVNGKIYSDGHFVWEDPMGRDDLIFPE